MGTINPQYCSNSNRASMDGTGDGREEEARRQIHNLALAAIEQVWMVPTIRNPNPRTRNTRRRVKSKFCHTKNLMRSTPASDFG